MELRQVEGDQMGVELRHIGAREASRRASGRRKKIRKALIRTTKTGSVPLRHGIIAG
jgi:hypothetical protein